MHLPGLLVSSKIKIPRAAQDSVNSHGDSWDPRPTNPHTPKIRNINGSIRFFIQTLKFEWNQVKYTTSATEEGSSIYRIRIETSKLAAVYLEIIQLSQNLIKVVWFLVASRNATKKPSACDYSTASYLLLCRGRLQQWFIEQLTRGNRQIAYQFMKCPQMIYSSGANLTQQYHPSVVLPWFPEDVQ